MEKVLKIQSPYKFMETAESAKLSVEQKMALVKRYVYGNLSKKGYFVYHLYRDDVIEDVCLEILNDERLFGKTKPINIYCNRASQISITKQRYYTAEKRKAFFTADSLDEVGEDEGLVLSEKIPAKRDFFHEQYLMLIDIKRMFGAEIHDLSLKILGGEKPTKEELCVLRSTRGLVDYLREE